MLGVCLAIGYMRLKNVKKCLGMDTHLTQLPDRTNQNVRVVVGTLTSTSLQFGLTPKGRQVP